LRNQAAFGRHRTTVPLYWKRPHFVIIDTPPQLGVLTINALVACTDVLIPYSLTTYSLIGVSVLERTMQELDDNLDLRCPSSACLHAWMTTHGD
jgi:cellulose biosynthesis protein BcsQ